MLKSASLSPTIMNDSALIFKSYFKFIMAANEFFFIIKKTFISVSWFSVNIHKHLLKKNSKKIKIEVYAVSVLKYFNTFPFSGRKSTLMWNF